MNETSSQEIFVFETEEVPREFSGMGENRVFSHDWQEAQDRVLLYLRTLGIPPVNSLKIAYAALRHAQEQAMEESDCHSSPIRLAMEALHTILERDTRILQNTIFSKYPTLQRRWRKDENGMPAILDSPQDPVSMPPIERRSMRVKDL